MPSRTEHAAKAKRNRDFLATLDVARWPDWAATVAFYVVVHTVSQLAEDGTAFADHGDRNRFLHDEHRPISRKYIQMKAVAEKARYESIRMFAAHHPPLHVSSAVIGTWLADIEKYVEAWLAAKG